ncbi:MAG: permease prefix domain 1-containing protein, partial [Candidatus Acidiferrales bacterium]
MKSWRLWFSRKKWEQQLDEELRFHVERQTTENIAAGFAPDEARRQAVLQLGAAEGVKEDCREQRRGFWMETL